MWAAKLSGEGARMWDTCEALRDALLLVGVGVDGGKVHAALNPETQRPLLRTALARPPARPPL
jgi:phosphoribosylformylglycinamidine synthase